MAFVEDSEGLRRHLTALRAAKRLHASEPDEARSSALRIARALARDAATRPDLVEQAQALSDSPDFDDRLQALIAALEHAAQQIGPGTVLVIEDDPDLGKLFAHVLREAGWQPLIAPTAKEAQDLVESHPISIIVLDLILPDADGRNLLLALREHPNVKAVPVLVVSAHADPHVQAECLALGASQFLQKPLEPRVLVDAVRRGAGAGASASRAGDGILDRAALATAYAATTPGHRALAVVAPARAAEGAALTGAALDAAIEVLSASLQETVGDRGVVARFGIDELATLFYQVTDPEPCQLLEEARERLARSGAGDLVAGLVSAGPSTEFEEALDEAGRLLYAAQTAPGGRVLCDLDAVQAPMVRVLLAEDDPLTAKLLIYRLSREPSFQVMHCLDGIEALTAAQEQQYDIAVLDINMPGIDGFDLLSRLRDMPQYRRTPIAMLTSLGSEEAVVRGLGLGANDYIVKPFSPSEVIARLRRLLGRSVRAQ